MCMVLCGWHGTRSDSRQYETHGIIVLREDFMKSRADVLALKTITLPMIPMEVDMVYSTLH